jgi:hypothetical protein
MTATDYQTIDKIISLFNQVREMYLIANYYLPVSDILWFIQSVLLTNIIVTIAGTIKYILGITTVKIIT